MDRIIYVRISAELDSQLETICQQMPGGKKSSVARFLMEKAMEEYQRRAQEGSQDQDWFPADAMTKAA